MIARAAVALAVLAHAVPALAEFEGVAELRMTGTEGGQAIDGKGRVFLSAAGWRMEMEVKLPGVAQPTPGAQAKPPAQVHRLVTLGKASSPGKSWMLNERTKTYHVVEADPAREQARQGEQDWKITRLGQDTVAGFPCTTIKAERPGQDESYEACLAKDFVSEAWLKSARQGKEWWVGAARKAGYTGYPVRLVGRARDGAERHRMEIVKVERKKIASSVFEVPAGYKEGSMIDVMAQSPEQQRQLEEAQRQAADALKDMSPEQRKMIEDLMKKHGAGQGQQP